MDKEIKRININFEPGLEFKEENFSNLNNVCGLYFIFLEKTMIPYPFRNSKLIYIGMSEKRTNSIKSRLSDHFNGRSGNDGIFNYKKKENLYFTYINFEMLKDIWKHRIEDLESYFILDFVNNYGVYPICNNKTGFEVIKKNTDVYFTINWEFFE